MSSIYSSSSWKPTVFLFEPKIFPSNLLFGQISIANTVFPADPFSCRCFLSYLKQSIINSKAFIPRSIGFYTSTNFHRNAQKWDRKNYLEEKIIAAHHLVCLDANFGPCLFSQVRSHALDVPFQTRKFGTQVWFGRYLKLLRFKLQENSTRLHLSRHLYTVNQLSK